jgi:hypothetical protein
MIPLTCATTRRIKQVRVLECSESETKALYELIPHVPEGDVVFVDHGLASYKLVPECQQRGVHVVMRISSIYKPKIVARLGPGDYLVEGKFTVPIPEAEQSGRKTRDITVKARMIVFWFDGEATGLASLAQQDFGLIERQAHGMRVRTKVIPLTRQHLGSEPVFETSEDFLKTTLRLPSVHSLG